MSPSTPDVPLELVAAVSGASRAIGELDAALRVAPHREAFMALLRDASAEWPALHLAMRCVAHELEVTDVSDERERRADLFFTNHPNVVAVAKKPIRRWDMRAGLRADCMA